MSLKLSVCDSYYEVITVGFSDLLEHYSHFFYYYSTVYKFNPLLAPNPAFSTFLSRLTFSYNKFS